MEVLSQLENNVNELLSRYQALQQEVATLRQENTTQRQEILRTHGELNDLQLKYHHLQAASALLGNTNEEERARAKQQLTYLIQMVDQTLETLKRG